MTDRLTASVQPLVLCVGSDANVCRDVRAGLDADRYDVIDCPSAAEGLAFTLDTRPDIVLVDEALEGGLDFVRTLTIGSRTPVLVMASPYGVERALAAGASDCIATPLSAALLRARVDFALRCSRAERAVERLTNPSSSTSVEAQRHGLLGYDAFVARLEAKLASAREGKGQVVLMYLSIDLSPTASDAMRMRAMHITIQRLKDGLRSRDNVSRADAAEQAANAALVSDHEVVVAFAGLERAQDAYKIARRLQQQLAQQIDVGDVHLTLPTNCGLAIHPEDGERTDALVDSARTAMQAARDEGRGAVRFARPEMNSAISERLALEVHLKHALELGQLLVLYQPRVSIATGRIVGVEALVRWKHPELGLVPPSQFIPIAEESGLILPIGEWVLREACAQAMRWRAAGVPPLHMAVNLSPAQFREADLVGVVRSALEDSGLPSDALELELTESMLLGRGDGTVKTLESLKTLGILLAIDDFGTGYSSLNYIKRFPIDTLKIDQSFIRDMLTTEQDSTLTTSIVLMGKGLGLTVVAEGVETRSQLSLLRVLGCDQAQGFLFSKPLPPDEIGKLVATGFPDSIDAGVASAPLRRDSRP